MGSLYVVATPIGNLKDITLRALEVLKAVDIILCEDTRVSLKLLKYYEINKKLVSYHKFNEKEKLDFVLGEIKKGKDIALITDAGMPCVSDPGYVLVKTLKNNNVSVYGIGGISASLTALSVSGLPADSFTFYGFFPRENKEIRNLFNEIRKSFVKTYIFYESPKRIIKTLEVLYENLGDVRISVSKELTKLHEKNYYGFLSEVLEKIKENDKSSVGEYTFVMYKDFKEEVYSSLSIEALLVDKMIKESCSLKDAVSLVNKENSNLTRSDIYEANLRLKDLIK